MNFKRWALTRYFFPLDTQGDLRLDFYLVHVQTYLRRNAAAATALLLLRAALPWLMDESVAALGQAALLGAAIPFLLMAGLCLCLVLDLLGRR